MKVTILHNVADRPLRMMDGYKDGDAMVTVYSYDVDDAFSRDVFAVAEHAFRLFNVGDDPDFGTPDERAIAYRARRNRSLSVGDIVKVGGAYLACQPVGFVAIDHEPTRVPLTMHGTTWDGEEIVRARQ